MSFLGREATLLADAPSGIEWEETPCLFCGCEEWTPLVEAPDQMPDNGGLWFMVVQCSDCGLCFTNPRPTPDSIGQFYRADYEPHEASEDAGGRTSWRERLPSWAQRQNWRKRLPLCGEGRLLDFGCGGGGFLLRMRRQGWNVVGIDTSLDLVLHLRDRHGLTALAGTLPHPELAEASFDMITMWHALEHTHQPLDVLGAAHQLLAPGGKLIVAAPNIDCFPFRWFGQAWTPLDLPRHLVHFAPWTLRLMLNRAGFRQIHVRMQRRTSWLRKTAKRAEQLHSRLDWGRRALKGRTAAGIASWYAYLTRQSDCMIAEAIKK